MNNKAFELNREVYIYFSDKKYITTFSRYSELVQNTVKKAMPKNYKINYIQTSINTESLYFTIYDDEKYYSFRISSHITRKYFNRKNFITNDYQDFKELGQAITEYLNSGKYMTIKPIHLLLLSFFSNKYTSFTGNEERMFYITNIGAKIEVKKKMKSYLESLLYLGALENNITGEIYLTKTGEVILTRRKLIMKKHLKKMGANNEIIYNINQIDFTKYNYENIQEMIDKSKTKSIEEQLIDKVVIEN